MTLVVEQSKLAEVSAVVVESFRTTGDPVRRTTIGKLAPRQAGPFAATACVVATSLRRVEVLAEADADLSLFIPALRQLEALEWDVVVLLPLERVGAAHAELRGSPCLLQPWWPAQGSIVFGRPEIP